VNSHKQLDSHVKSLEISVVLSPEKIIKPISTFNRWSKMINAEIDYWKTFTEGKSKNMRDQFTEISSHLRRALQYEENNIEQAKYELNQAYRLQNSQYKLIWSTTSAAKKIKELYDINFTLADGFISYTLNEQVNNLTDMNSFRGALEAYKIISDTCPDETVKFKFDTINERTSLFHSELDELTSIIEANKVNHGDEIEKLNIKISEMNELTENWMHEKNSEIEIFHKQKSEQFEKLEKAYKEGILIQEPAEHWKELTEKYLKEGDKWRKWVIGTSLILIIILLSLIYNLPEYMDVSLKTFSLVSLKGTLLIATIVSIGAYLIRIFVRLSLSSYHLSRDANERYQLTAFYLSLLESDGISENERNTVITSLFSRSETGLLNGESGPTLPDGVTRNISNLFTKGN
jgi:hypothetical protein